MTMRPGDLVHLPPTAPLACVYHCEDGTTWATSRTRRRPEVEGWVPYRVVGPAEDPDVFDTDTPPPLPPLPGPPAAVTLVLDAFPGAEVVGYDRAALCRAVTELLMHHDARCPDVFTHPAWQRLAEAEDGPDEELVVAARAVVSWGRSNVLDRMRREGWQAVIRQIDAYGE